LTIESLGGEGLRDRDAMRKLPQRLVNIRAADRIALRDTMAAPVVMSAIEEEQSALHGRGRVLVRVSGTEPLIRVMAEAPAQEETDAVCERLRAVVADALGDKLVG
jgi:phosphoglucosamine mutase